MLLKKLIKNEGKSITRRSLEALAKFVIKAESIVTVVTEEFALLSM
jgi:hypothetical protein